MRSGQIQGVRSTGPETGGRSPAYIYGSRVPDFRILAHALLHLRDRRLLVAWSNPTTRMLIVLFWKSRRK